MDLFSQKTSKFHLLIFMTFFGVQFGLKAQSPEPPLPVELLVGNDRLYFQMLVKKKFTPESRFGFFSVATYTADYKNRVSENTIVIPVQLNYTLGRGLGVMAGTDINSVSGFSPIIGPQHNFATRQILAVTVISFFLNQDGDFKFFGLYEYKPPLGVKWSLYTRAQMVYNQSLKTGTHNQSYLYLRAGVKRNSLIFGVGSNLERSGPFKRYEDNYGIFLRWEFK